MSDYEHTVPEHTVPGGGVATALAWLLLILSVVLGLCCPNERHQKNRQPKEIIFQVQDVGLINTHDLFARGYTNVTFHFSQ